MRSKQPIEVSKYKEYSDSDDAEFLMPHAANAVVEDPENAMIVEKVLGRKFIKDTIAIINDEGEEEMVDKIEELYFIKWKKLSYLHASWERKEDIEIVDHQGKLKLKRFLQTPQPNPAVIGELDEEKLKSGDPFEEEDIDYFNPELVEVQRVLNCDTPFVNHSRAKKPGDLLKTSNRKPKLEVEVGEEAEFEDEEEDPNDNVKYLVKWRGAPYSESTWERWAEIKSFNYQVWTFWKIQKAPKLPIKQKKSPTLQEYVKLEASPEFGIDTNGDDQLENEEEIGLRLRDYQLEGVNWLLWNWWHKRSCILADEMGLGKTIQTIGFLHQLRYMKSTQIDGPFLIIAPLSLVDQWQSEIATWSPTMNCVLFHGSAEARDIILANEFYHKEPFTTKEISTQLKKSNVCKFNILLTTFEMATKEIKILTKIHWKALIIDEAHKLKNQSSRLFSSLRTITRDHCVLLTGTPLQNKTEELWALLNFADENRFADLNDFLKNFGDLKEATQVARLHDMLKPYLLRRIKEDVEKSLPPKEETIIEVALTSLQKKFYRAIYEKNTSFLFKGVKASNQPSLMNVMMELRKCCNHPYLVRGVEERVIGDLESDEIANKDILHSKLVESSGKLVLLDKLLPRLFEQGHKVLIFSQMVRVLNILEDFLKNKQYNFERLDGSTKSNDRKEAVERFCKPSMKKFIMLLSTKAGGLGLNLTAADTVIIYDSDWNPQNDLQAQARAHRIGQTKAVMVYRLLTRKTYEMQMFHQASLKLGLDRAVLAHARNEQEEKEATWDAEGVSKPNLNAKEIDELLKRGAYDVFREDDTEQNEFVEADIDSILLRRSHKVVYEKNGSGTSNSLGSFSKASFVSADEKEDVDINDPDFWQKAVGLKEDSAVGSLLEDPTFVEALPYQRVRKQTKNYGDENLVDEINLKAILKPLRGRRDPDRELKKELQREQMLKDKQEREEAKVQKALQEAKAKSDPANWGPHSRDRAIKALSLFGFNRWEKIKTELKHDQLENKQLESFYRSYILQCGLIASEQEVSSDSEFIKGAIQRAKDIQVLVNSGQRQFDFASSLTDEKFIAKLRSGHARKSLNKLDSLAKLYHLLRKTVEDVYTERNVPIESTADLDRLMEDVTLDEVVKHLPLGDFRPSWTRIKPWWDLDCDNHLIIGIFRHGYSRFDLIKDDPTLVFEKKINEARLVQESTAGDVTVVPPVLEQSVPTEEDADKMDDNDGDNEDGEGKVSGNYNSNGLVPDARLINKLLLWLVSSESARLAKEQEELMRQQEGEKKKYADLQKKEAVEFQKRQLEIQKKQMQSEMQQRKAALMLGKKKSSEEVVKMSRKSYEPEKDADIDLSNVNILEFLFLKPYHILDVTAINLVHKSHVQGIKKCEVLLLTPNEYPAVYLTPNNDTNTDAIKSKENEEQNEVKDISNQLGVIPSQTFDSIDGTRLCVSFILLGVPLLECFDMKNEQFSFKNIEEAMGIYVDSSEKYRKLFSWDDIVSHSKVSQSPAAVAKFFRDSFLPLCYFLTIRKNLSQSANKNVLPNPMLNSTDHHFSTKGLCHIFVVRQHLCQTAFFLLSTEFDKVLDYLKSSRGRNVDNMPVWWCPWIHDLGLLLGIVKHGYICQFSLERIVEDESLPFNKTYLEEHIRRVFLYGSTDTLPAAYDEVRTVEEAESFVQALLLQFPDGREIDNRIMRILQEMTEYLSPYSPFRVKCFTLLHQFAEQVVEKEPEVSSRKRKISTDPNNSKDSSTKHCPAVPLKRFLRISEKRRKLLLSVNFPDLIPLHSVQIEK